MKRRGFFAAAAALIASPAVAGFAGAHAEEISLAKQLAKKSAKDTVAIQSGRTVMWYSGFEYLPNGDEK